MYACVCVCVCVCVYVLTKCVRVCERMLKCMCMRARLETRCLVCSLAADRFGLPDSDDSASSTWMHNLAAILLLPFREEAVVIASPALTWGTNPPAMERVCDFMGLAADD